MMTKNTFELVAGVMRKHRPIMNDSAEYIRWIATCETFAQQFLEQNPRFNSLKFYEACGFETAKVPNPVSYSPSSAKVY